jgi:glycyl-tRNA synthetase
MNTSMEQLVSLCKRRGFIFQGSEIYGGLAGTYDYGPFGALLKNNIKDIWLKKFVKDRSDTYLIDAAILMNARVWEATGHTAAFIDPLVEDLVTNKRYRADHLLEQNGVNAEKLSIQEMSETIKEKGLTSPDGNALGEVRAFNMMLETKVGAAEDTSAISYLRPETAQGIFVNYKNVTDSMSPKIPFGIAQIGKAFRNEITPRDFIFRLRELEQMEIEYFIHPSRWEEHFSYWLDEQMEFFRLIGIDESKLHQYEHPAEARSHYSKRTMDWEFDFPFGRKELSGLAYRTDFDLNCHSKHSGERLDYLDPYTSERFVPHVIEPSFGLDRAVLAVLASAYWEDDSTGETRTVLRLAPSVAPYLACVSPLLKNKEELVDKARLVYGGLKASFGSIAWDDNGNIGKRYRRQDEIGTPFCIVIDFETLEDQSVTVRDRDTAKQDRVLISELETYLKEKLQ